MTLPPLIGPNAGPLGIESGAAAPTSRSSILDLAIKFVNCYRRSVECRLARKDLQYTESVSCRSKIARKMRDRFLRGGCAHHLSDASRCPLNPARCSLIWYSHSIQLSQGLVAPFHEDLGQSGAQQLSQGLTWAGLVSLAVLPLQIPRHPQLTSVAHWDNMVRTGR